ncbi:MAG TPA: SOS response-associated peptidase [Gemmataceae bacterium]|jgi:putative SOS response-associated peptidase YedK|nr:SOS response-associated peptidase [Gemmataceae bacterium]
MCGRFTLSKPVRAVQDLFKLPEPPEVLKPRYNIAPTQVVAVVGLKPDGKTRGLATLRWGLIPSWANDPKRPHFNAKAETAYQLPTFRDSFKARRCLIPADGFYEWPKAGPKVAHHFRLKDGGVMAYAGIWDAWEAGDGSKLRTCAILTVAAVEPVSAIHDRMPLILPPGAWDAWLDPAATVAHLLPLLVSPPAGLLDVARLGPAVNKAGNEGPECLAPAS